MSVGCGQHQYAFAAPAQPPKGLGRVGISSRSAR
jgi:hypothetical protein